MAITNILKSIILDVYDHDKTPKTIKSIAADNDVRYIAAEIQSEGVRYDVSASSTVELIILRPDKVGVFITGQPQEFTYETDPVFDPDTGETTPGETVTYYGVYAELDQVALAKSGVLLGQFKITNGEQVLHTEIFKVNNGRALDAETSDWAGEYQGHNLDELVGRIEALEEGGVPSSVKGALITLLKAAVYSETGLTDEIATIESWASATAELVSISASYSGGTVRVGASLDSLRSDLTVIGTYQDSTTEVVTGYTLSGTLTEGTQTVTVSYGSKTTTFTVTVVSGSTLLHSWDFTQGLTDSVGGKVATATATQDGTGLHFASSEKYIEFPAVYAKDRTYEIDITSILRSGATLDNYGRLFMIDTDSVTGTGGSGYLLTAAKKGGDLFYMNGAWESSVIVSNATDADGSYYDGSTVGFYIDSTGKIHVYKDGTKLGASAGALAASYDGANVYFGSSSNRDMLYNAMFTGFRVYDGNKYGGA